MDQELLPPLKDPAGSPGSFLRSDGVAVSFAWEDVCMEVKVGKTTRHVLSGAFGEAKAGEVTAILGPSGGGKTSLLNVLAGRVSVSGNPLVSGRINVTVGTTTNSAQSLDLAEISAYVEQDDVLYAFSTVRETLMMSARLRLPHLSYQEQRQRVQQVIETLGLVPAANTIIGSDLPGQRGISGGERKRVALGCELLHCPRVIFADEPTSGLDAFQAKSVMDALCNLAKQGCTVIAAVHQPRSIIVNSFNGIVLMSGGRVAYSGAAGKACDAFFAKAGCPVPEGYNRADHYLDTISVDYRSLQLREESECRVNALLNRATSDRTPGTTAERSSGRVVVPPRKTAHPGVAFELLAVRAFREIWRDKLTLTLKLALNIVFGLIYGCLYYQMPFDQVSFQNRTGICFFMAMNGAFGSVISIAQVIPRQLKIVNRDRANKLYGVLPFYVSQFMVSLPFEIVPALANGAIVYFMTNLRHGAEHFFLFVLFLFLENLTGMALGMLLSAAFRSPEMVPQIAPLFVILFLMFSGYFINLDSIPVAMRWLSDVSFIRFAFQGVAVNEFAGATNFEGPPLQPGAPLLDGDQWLDQLKFQGVHLPAIALKLVLEMGAFHVFAITVLFWRRPAFVTVKETQLADLAA